MKTYVILLLMTSSYLKFVQSDTHILYNTKAATSDLDWTLHPPYNAWEELSSLDLDDNVIRSYQVCNIESEEPQDNWIRSPYINAQSAQRVYIDIEYSVMKCESCRETFTLYYYPSSDDVASSTFPPWRESPFIKIDTVAANARFDAEEMGQEGINRKTLVIGPLKRQGFYIAAQDQGACMSLVSMKLYYQFCPDTIMKLAHFPATVAGGEVASLVPVQGQCVPNAEKVGNETELTPTYRCKSNGEWTVPTGGCQCKAGYTLHKNGKQCVACGYGYYKPDAGNHRCYQCPMHSQSYIKAAKFCSCERGFYRTETESVDSHCTAIPSAPKSASFSLDGSEVGIWWMRPESNGGRSDVYFSVHCRECDSSFNNCQNCPNTLLFTPRQTSRITEPTVKIENLTPSQSYIIKISSLNGVSTLSSYPPKFTTVRFNTSASTPSEVLGISLLKRTTDSLTLHWQRPLQSSQDVTGYELQVYRKDEQTRGRSSIMLSNVENESTNWTLTKLNPGTTYVIKIRAATSSGFGYFSDQVEFTTLEEDNVAWMEEQTGESQLPLIIGAGAGAILVLAVIIAILIVKKRRDDRQDEESGSDQLKKFGESKTALLSGKDNFEGHIVNVLSSPHMRKTYVDYRDPHKGVKEMAREVDIRNIVIESVIGRGEFGEVCKGKIMQDGEKKKYTEVAVKRLRHGASLIDQTNFLREACTMAQFSDPNIISLRGVVTKSMPAMILTEYMENGSLDKYLQQRRGELTLLDLMKMLRGIASGMKYLSNMKYVHRDLAARNILVDKNLVCKVSDFGLSRTLENDPHATYTTQGGKIALRWTAPESIRYRKFTSASDVWSYGIVTWEVMSYGEKPYWEMSNDDVTEVIEDGYRLPAPLDCPVALHNLMLQCWCYDPVRRPSFYDILSQICKFVRQPALLTSSEFETQHNDISAPLLNPSTPSTLQDISTLDEWLDMVKLGIYRRSFYENGISDLEALAQINPSDLERLGISSPQHRTRLQSSLDSLRHHLAMARQVSQSRPSSGLSSLELPVFSYPTAPQQQVRRPNMDLKAAIV